MIELLKIILISLYVISLLLYIMIMTESMVYMIENNKTGRAIFWGIISTLLGIIYVLTVFEVVLK